MSAVCNTLCNIVSPRNTYCRLIFNYIGCFFFVFVTRNLLAEHVKKGRRKCPLMLSPIRIEFVQFPALQLPSTLFLFNRVDTLKTTSVHYCRMHMWHMHLIHAFLDFLLILMICSRLERISVFVLIFLCWFSIVLRALPLMVNSFAEL